MFSPSNSKGDLDGMPTAWEVNTAVYKNYKNVSTQDAEPYV